MATSNRPVAIRQSYKPEESDKIRKLNSTYLGYVKDNSDTLKMGRIKVWIPELSTDPEYGLFTVNFCSPFAGASGLNSVGTGSQSQSQTSYGMHLPAPDLENEVIIQFINGDPNRGIYIGGLFQQHMNNMVPGIPKGDTTGSGGSQAPVQEYNKKDNSQATKSNPQRPTYDTLNNGLKAQGLDQDNDRGQSTSSARRESPSKVLGILSPGGSQIVVDDNPDSQFIRFRTKSGTQVVINDSIGYIYMITKNGNAWLELSDDSVNLYSANTINLRSQQDLNLHADGNMNFFGAKGVNIATSQSVSIAAGTNMAVNTGKDFSTSCIGSINVTSNDSINFSAKNQFNAFSKDKMALTTKADLGVKTDASYYITSKKTFINSKDGPTATQAADATPPQIGTKTDKKLDKNHSSVQTKTNVSALPTHEPYAGHPGTSANAASSSSSSSSGTPNSIDGQNSSSTSNTPSSVIKPSTTNAASTTSNISYSASYKGNSSVNTSLNSSTIAPSLVQINQYNVTIAPTIAPDYFIPTSGNIVRIYGEMNGIFHPGVDIGGNNGKPVIASQAGKVTWADFGTSGSGFNGYGNCICIDHSNGFKTVYGQLSSMSVKAGNTVTQGQVIGQVGATGTTTGPHLHFEIIINGSDIDPGTVIPQLGIKGTTVTAGPPTAVNTSRLTNTNTVSITNAQSGSTNV